MSVLETLKSKHLSHVGASVVIRKILEKSQDRHEHSGIATQWNGDILRTTNLVRLYTRGPFEISS